MLILISIHVGSKVDGNGLEYTSPLKSTSLVLLPGLQTLKIARVEHTCIQSDLRKLPLMHDCVLLFHNSMADSAKCLISVIQASIFVKGVHN